MNNDQVTESLENLEKQENMTAEEIRKKIRLAVSLMLKSSHSDIRKLWQDIPCQGEIPDLEEMIDYLILKLDKNE